MRKLKVGDVLKRVKDTTTLDDNQQYKRVTIKMNHKGVSIRDIELGINIGTKSQFFIREGQFLLSKIDARNGAFGIVPPEADGAIITGNFWAFDVNQKELNIDLFHIMTSLPFFDELSKKASSGTTNRQYLDEKKFLAQEITLPPIEEQDIFITHFKKIQIAHRNTLTELKTQFTLIAKLRSSILSDAVSGRLVPQDSTDEPASMLLEQIKAEKERLIKEGKLKRDKPLSLITADEIPYELPVGWVWCRFGDSGLLQRGKSKHRPRNDSKLFYAGTFPLVQTGDVANAKNYQFTIKTCTGYYNEIGLEQSRLWPKGTLCITIAANIADIGFLNSDACFPDSIVGFQTLLDYVITEYVSLFLINAKSDLIKYAPATAQKNINLGILNELLFPLPPLAEQHRIVAKVEKLMATCAGLEAEVAKSRAETDRLMQTILKEAFENKKSGTE